MKKYEKVTCIERDKDYYALNVLGEYKELERSELLHFLDKDNLYIEDIKNYHANNCGTRNPRPDADYKCTCGIGD